MSKRRITKYQKKRLQEISMFIRNWRLNECLTQSDFSKLSESHTNTIQRLESGKQNLSIITLFNCVDAMGLTLAQFFDGME